MPSQKIMILLIEDDIDDVELLKEALTNTNISYTIEVIMEGDKVAPYLENQHVTPDIIVMDLNLPKTDGREIMKHIKAKDKFKNIPLIVLSTSSSKEDIDYSYLMGVDKFITKPITMDGWDETGLTIIQLSQLA